MTVMHLRMSGNMFRSVFGTCDFRGRCSRLVWGCWVLFVCCSGVGLCVWREWSRVFFAQNATDYEHSSGTRAGKKVDPKHNTQHPKCIESRAGGTLNPLFLNTPHANMLAWPRRTSAALSPMPKTGASTGVRKLGFFGDLGKNQGVLGALRLLNPH